MVAFFSSSCLARAEAKAQTLDELNERFDSSSCKECHEKIYTQWEKSQHARSLMGVDDGMLLAFSLQRLAQMGIETEKFLKTDYPCFKCHFPQVRHGTDQAVRELAAACFKEQKAVVRKANIGCLVCHHEKAVVHGRPEEGVIYGSKDIPDHPGRPVKKSPLLKSSLMCGQCHGLGPVLDHPDIPVQCATLYGSYLHAYIPSGGTKTCQDCHIKDGDHYMPPDFSNKEDFSSRMRDALPIEVQTLGYVFQNADLKSVPMIAIKTKITSKAGHRIPDG
jgi:hypothetical protein